MMKFAHRIGMALLILCFTRTTAQAQNGENELQLRLKRNFGYSDGGHIQGAFTLQVESDQALVRVQFLLDGELMAELDSPPYRVAFSTSDYDLGAHTLWAVGYTADGRVLRSEARTLDFVSAEVGWDFALRFLMPLMILLLGVAILAVGLQWTLGRRSAFKIGSYGMAGGAVCPRCAMPFSRHLLSPNMIFGKVERCPHCGKWSLVRRASTSEFSQAEERYQAQRTEGLRPPESEAERLERLLDDSRFD